MPTLPQTVKSHRGTQFRIWAMGILKEYIKKGFALDDDRLKRLGGGNYFDELLARIRDIRSSEKVFWRKVLEIYATSIDYDISATAKEHHGFRYTQMTGTAKMKMKVGLTFACLNLKKLAKIIDIRRKNAAYLQDFTAYLCLPTLFFKNLFIRNNKAVFLSENLLC